MVRENQNFYMPRWRLAAGELNNSDVKNSAEYLSLENKIRMEINLQFKCTKVVYKLRCVLTRNEKKWKVNFHSHRINNIANTTLKCTANTDATKSVIFLHFNGEMGTNGHRRYSPRNIIRLEQQKCLIFIKRNVYEFLFLLFSSRSSCLWSKNILTVALLQFYFIAHLAF